MSKMMQGLLFVGLLVFAGYSQAGVTIDVAIVPNSNGDLIYTLTAISDGAPITSLGINVQSFGGSLGQVHPSEFSTELQNYNLFFGSAAVDEDTQALFATAADSLLVVSGSIDTAYELDVYFTGFAPFQSRAVVQIVIVGGGLCDVCVIGAVADGVEYNSGNLCNPPEPASMGLMVVGGLALMRRR